MSSDGAGFAAAVRCIDERVHQPLTAWVTARFGVEFVDLLTQPGPDVALCCAADDELAHLRRHRGISVEAYRSGALVIAGHDDCAANPVSASEHRDHLRPALVRARAWAPPGLQVVAAWVDRAGRVEEINGTPPPREAAPATPVRARSGRR